MATPNHPPVVLLGYDSSPFTNKVRLALRVKGIPFSYFPVPSMMPRPILRNTFGLTYRKIPVLAIGREIYCDTSLIIEALEHYFPQGEAKTEQDPEGWGTVYPKFLGEGGEREKEWVYRGLVRGFASFWVDRPLFRTTTGLIPPSVWSTSFGTDRAGLIGHALDAEKLGAKIPQNLANLDLHLSMLEPMLKRKGQWIIPTQKPSLADISLYYQLRWGIDISQGKGVYNLTGGRTSDVGVDIVGAVFNEVRYPGVWSWFHAFEAHISSLPDTETVLAESSREWINDLRDAPLWEDSRILVPSESDKFPTGLDERRGLVKGARVSVAPDDTGRGDPTFGTLMRIGAEEVVIETVERGVLECRIHFPRLGFVVKLAGEGKERESAKI